MSTGTFETFKNSDCVRLLAPLLLMFEPPTRTLGGAALLLLPSPSRAPSTTLGWANPDVRENLSDRRDARAFQQRPSLGEKGLGGQHHFAPRAPSSLVTEDLK